MKIMVGKLRSMLKGALTCVSGDATLPTLCCVNVTLADNVLTLAGTDRYRAMFASYEVPEELACDGSWDVLLHSKDAKAIIAALPKGKGSDWLLVDISCSNMFLVLNWEAGSYTAILKDGEFPAVAKLIPTDDPSLPNGEWLARPSLLDALVKAPGDVPWKMAFFDGRMLRATREEFSVRWTFILTAIHLQMVRADGLRWGSNPRGARKPHEAASRKGSNEQENRVHSRARAGRAAVRRAEGELAEVRSTSPRVRSTQDSG